MQYSRLSRRYDRLSRQQAYLLLAGSMVLLILFFVFGFPAILNLASTISYWRRGNTQSTIDKGLAPTTPRLAENFDATNSATIKLLGIADSKVTVELYQNGSPAGTTISGDDGVFSFDVDLIKGENIFIVQATSTTGVKSSRSESYKISFLSSPPKLEITSPKDQDTVKDNSISILGQTDSGASVTVNDRLAFVKDDGSFTYNLTLNGGDNKVKIVASDRAGNQMTKEITVKYQP